ncbi:hypothetical protein B5X24_HaOG212109 [Helicoverpa armigera]|uniref:BTB domain-containing protein n=1 Tax=Helicoverpa armigera TaxID=29058 RepID=A0A2W1BDV2_HELAM|nr:hypothetical protein B5X24_HaOG212109 [Helicoverpa armigera]
MSSLPEMERFCDVTLYCSPSFATQVAGKDTVEPQNIRGVSLRAHRVVLAACSELLGTLLGAHEAQGEPVLVIDGAEPKHLKALLDYMYTGEMNVHHVSWSLMVFGGESFLELCIWLIGHFIVM